ncbi:hypothetical protein QNI19_23355 [Cytophagaceae bacterium DM2B3-1]|uniref:Uncharacterized protein n=2 Tax=Xanthocytophaga TaxID=3078918 RepID=A0AAE3QKX5_9BACT|nr:MULTISPECIES: hypothetical protein [Xanthocytophaga]MDJ1467997.1 hypothetical protein [Xanthocytophaga flavus]MDJ1481252.1 hypothetical protein [Xanthocytophaga flavus]MDJ1495891.1 hypothetical protein [Xanthocytophaga flavus]MDJ1502271.1 hypothetical protein [Xanthocytophaga agilis]
MNESLIDFALFKAIKPILREPEIHSLFCAYLRDALAFKKIILLPAFIKHDKDWDVIREEFELSREMLDITLQLSAELTSLCSSIMRLGHLPISELDRLLDIFDTRRRVS